ncbi:MAG: ABC transporter substrate-binding protein [Spirochaetaceae bacterium]|nr:ABC transporter substrate-binding protein [Spirochaetaceae bacterium]
MKRILWVVLSSLLAASPLLAAGGEEQPATVVQEEPRRAGEPEYGGTLTVTGELVQYPPTSWDPAEWIWTSMIWTEPFLQSLLLGDFVNNGPRGSNDWHYQGYAGAPYDLVIGLLAESWTVPDDRTIILKIRKGVMWHEVPGVMASRELTAEDVAYTWNRNISAEGAWDAMVGLIDSVTATDTYTVEFKLTAWMPDWINKIGDADYATRVYPREVVEAGPGDWRNWRGIGTGPFLLDDFVEGSTVTYVRNPTYTVPYWDTATINGKDYEIPFIDRMVHSLMTDISAQIAALRTGKIDQHDNLTAEYVQSLRNTNPDMQFMSKPSPRKHYVGMRLDAEPFDDVRVRKAMAMAIDRQAIVDAVWGGEGEIYDFPYEASMPETLYTPLDKLPESTAEQFEYNPERARELLAEAGYPDGFETTLNSYSNEPYGSLSEIVVAFWNDIGVDVAIELLEGTSFDAMLTAKTYAPLTISSKGYHIDPFQVINLVWIDPFLHNTALFDLHPDYAELKDLFDRAYASIDMVESMQMMKELSQKLLATVAFTQLPTPFVYHAVQPWVENYYGSQILFFSPAAAHLWINSDLKQGG